MTLFAVTATVTRKTTAGETTSSLPLFFLDSRVQGILSTTGAASVARNLLALAAGSDVEIHVHVEESTLPADCSIVGEHHHDDCLDPRRTSVRRPCRHCRRLTLNLDAQCVSCRVPADLLKLSAARA